jgi:hypothetical protein
MANLPAVATQLERLESNLPIRAAWMAWCALSRLSGGDVVALANARDRALERLFHQGLCPEFDLPSFLRMSGRPDADRFRVVHERLPDLRKQVHRWLAKAPPAEGQTAAYADLMFSYAFARLGESTPSLDLLAEAEKALPQNDEVHRWLLEGFTHRIRSVQEGRPNAGPLPDALVLRLKEIDPIVSYNIERLRTESRILEPFEKFESQRRYVEKWLDAFGQRLLGLIDQPDRQKLTVDARSILAGWSDRNEQQNAKALTVLLQIAPRLGEAFARELLPRARDAVSSNIDLPTKALLLERALLLAANFDQSDEVRSLVAAFRRLVSASDRKSIAGVWGSLVSHCFRSLSKLGMNDALEEVFQEFVAIQRSLAHQGGKVKSSWLLETAVKTQGDLSLGKGVADLGKLMVQVASGWLHYHQTDRASELLDAVRDVLLQGKLAAFWRMKLAAAYLEALAQAPIDFALHRIEDLFANLSRAATDYRVTMAYYGLGELSVIEAAVLAVVGEGASLDAKGRRWLDEDEFIVRRRIHRDLREALAKGGP